MNLFKFALQFSIITISSATIPNRESIRTKVLSIFSFFQDNLLERTVENAAYTTDVKFWCRNPDDDIGFLLELDDDVSAGFLNSSLPLGFLIHGWMDEGGAEWVDHVQTTWIRYKPGNVCVVDWKVFAKRDYKSAVMRTYDVGRTLADMIKHLEWYNFDRQNITIVGFSLGAHAAGHAGKLLHGEVGEIIGLDPAGPLFTVPVDVGAKYRLDETDAKYVQIMHTAGGTLGTHVKCGHSDFYPNGGVSPQSNCMFFDTTEDKTRIHPVGCSHSMVLQYFRRSMNPKHTYEGVQCSSYRFFLFGICNNNRKSRFGFHSERIPGNYFFTTEPDLRSALRLKSKKKPLKKKFKKGK